MSKIKQIGRQYAVVSDNGSVIDRYASKENAERRLQAEMALQEETERQASADFKAGKYAENDGPGSNPPCCEGANTTNEHRADATQMTMERKEWLLSQSQLGRSVNKAAKDKAKEINEGRDKKGRMAKEDQERSSEIKQKAKTDAGHQTETIHRGDEKTRREV
jgi:hypothetical protein